LTEFPGLTGTFSTILIDPPWRFINRTGKVAPEHRRLHRYETMSFEEIGKLPIAKYAKEKSHLYMWCPNALLPEGLTIMREWGFKYKSNIVWYKIRKDGGPDGRGVGFYFRKRDGTAPVRCPGIDENAGAGEATGKYHPNPEGRAF